MLDLRILGVQSCLLIFPGWLWSQTVGLYLGDYMKVFCQIVEFGNLEDLSFSKSLTWFILCKEPIAANGSPSFHFVFQSQDNEEKRQKEIKNSSLKAHMLRNPVLKLSGWAKECQALQLSGPSSVLSHMPGASIDINESCVCMWTEDRSWLCINSSAMVKLSSCVSGTTEVVFCS